ncbi:uncharacterized protein LOC107703788 [Sinocyclocheilus anshuiensis]|uniref:uncharacterized protein LOC107703788 n=1 Tax=Sinocyclocheilus anshuiensis TaxID=1608454 RepID=UPI0007B7D804|nr:PREDICTED: uncharacterized protein LOC107703788 [Sinocyclocheilus anshuiensis]
MELSQLPLVLLLISNVYSQHTEERPKPKVTIKPDEHVFRGETVTLRCDIYSEGVTSWQYIWYKDGSFYTFSELQELTFSPVTEFDAGKYSCYRSERGVSSSSYISDEVTLTVSVPRAVLSVSPQKWLTEGDPVTLICQVNGSSTGWTFSWYTETVSSANSIHYKRLSDSSRGAGGNYTVSSAALKHTGVHVCRAERGKPAYNSTISNTQLIWVTGVSPPVSLIVSPSRTQHFTTDSLSLSCEDQSNSTGWRMRRYRDSGRLEGCSSVWGSQTGSTCTIRSTIPKDTGVYWCESESGEKYHPVNITTLLSVDVCSVSVVGVILESPVHPVTEGETLTLRCLYHHSTPPNLRADFYKDGSLIQNQTTEMIIPAVSKSHEGFYSCKHTERGESRKSWISVTASSRTSGSDGFNPVIVGVTAGLTFLIIVFLVLLWRYRNNKGERSQSASSVSQQQNSSQTSEQNQSEAGHKALMSGTAHIYDSLDATTNKNISTDIVSGPTEVTYAEIELKSTEKQKKKKENKGETLTLRCLYHHSTPPNLRADFYKDGSLIQNQTTEMIIPAVSKSHEGFYSCKHTERGESRKSWISVTASSRTSGSDGFNPVIVGVTAGLTFLIIVFLVLLWRYRNNKGERSQSASSVSQQQNSSQTSEQNQSEAGHKALMSGTAHIYDSLDATTNKNISTDIVSGPTEVTYAEIELKSTEKQKKKKENKGNTSESSDTVYSQLNLVTHQCYLKDVTEDVLLVAVTLKTDRVVTQLWRNNKRRMSSLELTIEGVIGGSVVLPCSSTENELEIEGKGVTSEQSQAYKNRAEMFPDQYVNGNFTLKLNNLTSADSGIYYCYISPLTLWKVQLRVKGV